MVLVSGQCDVVVRSMLHARSNLFYWRNRDQDPPTGIMGAYGFTMVHYRLVRWLQLYRIQAARSVFVARISRARRARRRAGEQRVVRDGCASRQIASGRAWRRWSRTCIVCRHRARRDVRRRPVVVRVSRGARRSVCSVLTSQEDANERGAHPAIIVNGALASGSYTINGVSTLRRL